MFSFGLHTFLQALLLSLALAKGHVHQEFLSTATVETLSFKNGGDQNMGLRFLSIGDDCSCNGTEVHCTGDTSEDLCSCHEDGDLECLGATCHCDGSTTVHCSDESEDSYCICTDGVVSCDASATVDNSKDWGKMIWFCLLVNFMTLAGVVLVGGEYLRRLFCPSWDVDSEARYQWTNNYIPMFACGALLATMAFLILPEAYLHIEESLGGGDDHDHDHRFLEEEEEVDTESPAAWRWGTSVLCGFLIPYVVNFFLPGSHHGLDEEVRHYMEIANKQGTVFNTAATNNPMVSSSDPAAVEDEDTEEGKSNKIEDQQKDAATATTTDSHSNVPAIDWSLFMAICLGDFFHNFSDGVFIGTSFLLCDTSVALTVVAATVAHELPQELADFFLLVNQCHLSPMLALALNFLSGLSVVLGGIIVFLIPDMSAGTIGVVLAMGGGIYLYVAICECFTRAERAQHSFMDKVCGFFGFVLGAVAIGLVLLNHEHCHAH